jgi:hypothetical protein
MYQGSVAAAAATAVGGNMSPPVLRKRDEPVPARLLPPSEDDVTAATIDTSQRIKLIDDRMRLNIDKAKVSNEEEEEGKKTNTARVID